MKPSTKFWLCERCGFANAPHLNRSTPEANARCEQCGAEDGQDVPPAELVAMKPRVS